MNDVKVAVLSRDMFEKLVQIDALSKDIPIISISDGNKVLGVESYNILQLEFFDTSYSFTKEQAKRIKDFVDKNNNSKRFIVHCHAGISRSGAVGTWIVEYLKGDYNCFCKMNPNILPNADILVVLRNI